MRNKILIFCVIIFNSCSNREDISGIYSSSKASWSDIITYNTKSSIGNSTLVLKKTVPIYIKLVEFFLSVHGYIKKIVFI
jgi:hypothetical protein